MKRYVDDTLTVLGKDRVDGFLQHLNSQQSTIRFTMEIEKDNTIHFLDTSVSRDSNGLLTTTVYRKPTHTDQYLAYDSHHPQSVKRGIVECLYDLAKHLTSKPSTISEEKKHLSSVLVSNRYRSSFVRKLTKTTSPTANKEPTQEFKSTVVLPYIKGVSALLLRHLGRSCTFQVNRNLPPPPHLHVPSFPGSSSSRFLRASPRANEKMAERSFDSFVGQDIEFIYKMGLEGLHGYYFTFSYAARYIFCFLYFCSGFSLEDF